MAVPVGRRAGDKGMHEWRRTLVAGPNTLAILPWHLAHAAERVDIGKAVACSGSPSPNCAALKHLGHQGGVAPQGEGKWPGAAQACSI